MERKISKKSAERYNKILSKGLKNPVFRAAYNEERFVTSVMAMLYQARKNAKLSQKDLAKISSIPQPALSRMESGTQNITLVMLYRYLSGIGKPPHVVDNENRHAITF